MLGKAQKNDRMHRKTTCTSRQADATVWKTGGAEINEDCNVSHAIPQHWSGLLCARLLCAHTKRFNMEYFPCHTVLCTFLGDSNCKSCALVWASHMGGIYSLRRLSLLRPCAFPSSSVSSSRVSIDVVA
eukprot:GHVT01025039.1.p2 GENE.GHVT01025039.1~~GHVT01025039.1.p2  ORF type:complete len:129 (-),score=9.34 GHVT01025039.1:3462-3848(-)